MTVEISSCLHSYCSSGFWEPILYLDKTAFNHFSNNVTDPESLKIIISNNYRKIDTKKSDEKFEPLIASIGSMVNSGDRMIGDLLLTNIRA